MDWRSVLHRPLKEAAEQLEHLLLAEDAGSLPRAFVVASVDAGPGVQRKGFRG